LVEVNAGGCVSMEPGDRPLSSMAVEVCDGSTQRLDCGVSIVMNIGQYTPGLPPKYAIIKIRSCWLLHSLHVHDHKTLQCNRRSLSNARIATARKNKYLLSSPQNSMPAAVVIGLLLDVDFDSPVRTRVSNPWWFRKSRLAAISCYLVCFI
jgi:hypothetical protein